MKKTKKFGVLMIASILAISLPLSSTTIQAEENVSTFKNPETYLETQNSSYKESEVMAVTLITNILRRLAMPFLKAIGASTSFPQTKGEVIDYGNGLYLIMYGSFTFNTEGIGSDVYKDLLVSGRDTMKFNVYSKELFPFNQTITVRLRDTNDPDKVYKINKTLKSGENISYSFPGAYNTQYSNYYIHLSSNETKHWQTEMWYTVVNVPCTGTCPVPTTSTISTVVNEINNAILHNDKYFYINNEKLPSTPNYQSDKLTFNELYDEFYDSTTNRLTNQTKSLLPNTTVHINDVITDITYKSEDDYTVIKFASNYSDLDYHSIYFKGDLTSEYSIGDTLNLKFNLVKIAETNGHVFVNLDYNLYDISSGYPSIEEFLY